jgi:hypothetical protein
MHPAIHARVAKAMVNPGKQDKFKGKQNLFNSKLLKIKNISLLKIAIKLSGVRIITF